MRSLIIVLSLSLILSACHSSNQVIDLNTDESQEKVQNNAEETNSDVYLTGEIITDGIYDFNENSHGAVYFIPDKESRTELETKYGSEESYILFYDDESKVESLPVQLGIYKVKVKIDEDEAYDYLFINDIQLTDNIGTVLYEGKNYETNEIYYDIKVKDTVCGLIAKWVQKTESGLHVRFAGEIETEGYYNIYFDEMYNANIGKIFIDEKYYENIPVFIGEGNSDHLLFIKTNSLFDELENFSAFGRGKFKNSNYSLVYNIGMGRDPNNYLTEIISLDENYKGMFELNKDNSIFIRDISPESAIVSATNCDEMRNPVSFDYYYINKKNPVKLFMFTSEYYYNLKEYLNGREFILSSDGYNTRTNEMEEPHDVKCVVNDSVITAEKIDEGV